VTVSTVECDFLVEAYGGSAFAKSILDVVETGGSSRAIGLRLLLSLHSFLSIPVLSVSAILTMVE
jgi:hypothetical protein